MKNFDRIINNCADLETIEIMSEEDIYLKGCMELWLKTLKNVMVHSETPPVYLGSEINLFSGSRSTMTLYVPCDSAPSYRGSRRWTQPIFKKILCIEHHSEHPDETAVKDVRAGGEGAQARYYDLTGRPVDCGYRGLAVSRQGDKVIMR